VVKASLSCHGAHTAQWERLNSTSGDRMSSKGRPVKELVEPAWEPTVFQSLPRSPAGGNVDGNRLLLCRLKVQIYGLPDPELHKQQDDFWKCRKTHLSVAFLASWKLKDTVKLRENSNSLQQKIQLNLCLQHLPNHRSLGNTGGLEHRALRGQGRK